MEGKRQALVASAGTKVLPNHSFYLQQRARSRGVRANETVSTRYGGRWVQSRFPLGRIIAV